MSSVRVAVDIGGTFTDICILDKTSNTLRIPKLPTSAEPIDAALTDVRLFAHGTTVATNALIQRKLPLTAMVTTADFRDVIEIGRST